MKIDLSTLNQNQLRAVEWQDGPLLVLAGPGSGKTRVLTYRIARLIENSINERYKILGVTFTNKAASEMRSRIEGLAQSRKGRALLTTFHSFAAEILRQHGHHIGLRPDFTLLVNQADREAVLNDAMATLPDELAETIPDPRNALPILDQLTSECVDDEEVRQSLGKHRHGEFLTRLFAAYHAKLIQANQLDFGSLIGATVKLLEQRSAIGRQIQRVYRYVCVDEFQDTNAIQFRMLLCLVPTENPNLFVVADDDQIIYQWNGANPKRLDELQRRFSIEVVQLPENYRCPPAVIELANNLIRHNIDRAAGKEQLKAHKISSTDSQLRVEHFADFDKEAEWIVSELKAASPEVRSESVILARTKKLLDGVMRECERQGVPAYIATRKSEFISPPLVWMHAALRLANARQDREQLRRLCKAFFTLEGNDIRVDDVIAASSFHNGDYLRTWLHIALNEETVSAATKQFLECTRETLLERSDHSTFIEAAFAWFEQIKRKGGVTDSAFDDYHEEKQVWDALQQDIIERYGRDEVTLHSLLQQLDLRSKEAPPGPNSVRCLTIHTAKGLEFKRVYLIGVVEEQLPTWAATKKGDDSLEMREERRNCFVAITRAEEALTITYASRYFGYAKKPSRFLAEMGIAT